MRVLDLCSGTGSATAAFKEAGHDVVTLELDPDFDADLCMDVRAFALDPIGHLRRVRPDGWRPDFIWASPPCTVFSLAGKASRWVQLAEPWPAHPRYGRRVPNDEAARLGCQVVEACLDAIEALQPLAWLMENPRAGLRTMRFMQDRAPAPVTVTYCQYGEDRMKPTDLWGVMPSSWQPRPACKNGDSCHEAAPRGSKTGTQGIQGAKARSMVPAELSAEICAALTQPRCIVDATEADHA